MTMTRMSLLIAMSILRRLLTCAWLRDSISRLLILVTPSTSSATVSPNFLRMSSSVYSVSSTVSCKTAARKVSLSMRKSERMMATSTGCMMKGSPGFAELALVSILGKEVCFLDCLAILIGQIYGRILDEYIDAIGCRLILCLCRYALLVAHVNHLLYILCAFDLIVRQNGAIEPLE